MRESLKNNENSAHLKMEHMRKRKDFLAANKQGDVKVMAGVVMQKRERQDDNPPRRGITVTRKIGNAVKRNYVRRKLREASRDILPQIALQGCDYVLIGRKNTETRHFEKLKNDIKRATRALNQKPKGKK